MKLLIFEWGAGTYSYRDVVDSFEHNNVEYFTVSYEFTDKNNDDFFIYRFGKFLDGDSYDAVFSTNYFPLVAKCCHSRNIKYISWSYDNPLDVLDIEDTLGYPENYVFLFDKIQVEGYRQKGFTNVYHMPLAVNQRRLKSMKLSSQDIKKYSSDISFVGKLYKSDFDLYLSAMSDDMKQAMVEAVNLQMQLHGKYIIDEILTDDVLESVNSYFKVISPDTSFRLSREALSYAMSAEATRKERIILLKLLSERFSLNLYSDENNELLGKAHYKGTCNYYTEMNKIFMASKINLNINLKISQSGIPLRGMDVFGCGGFLMSTYQPEIDEYFGDGRGVVLFDSIEDACAKTEYYLGHEEERLAIAENGRKTAFEQFTYDIQLRKIFECAGLIK